MVTTYGRRMNFYIENGLPQSYLVFQNGVYMSAIRLFDRAYVTLDEKFQETDSYSNLNDWYQRTLRATFAKQYL